MPATATKADSAATKKAKSSGQVVIIWDPQKDGAVPAPPVGAKNDRPLLYSWMQNPEEVEKVRELDDAQRLEGRSRQVRAMRLESLPVVNPGLNWIDAELWQKALDDSLSKGSALDSEGYLQRLSREGAIVVIRPQGTGSDIGDINSYSRDEAMQIIAHEPRIAILSRWEKEATDTQVAKRITKRLGQLQGKGDR